MRGLGIILVYFTAKASHYRPSKANPSHKIFMMRERAEYSPGLFREAVKACCIPLIYRVWCTQSPNFRASAVHKLKTKTKNWYEYGTWLFKTPWCQTWKNVQNTSFHIEDRALLRLAFRLTSHAIFSIWRRLSKWNKWFKVNDKCF